MVETSETLHVRNLILLGGGHSHVEVLRRLAMDPLPDWRITLVSREAQSPYSGMVPGHIAGHYTFDDCHIDLHPLAHRAGVRFYQAEAVGLDLDRRRVLLKDRPPMAFELLSLDLGSRPRTDPVPGAAEHALPIKPIDRFLAAWGRLVEGFLGTDHPWQIAVVGAGAGGVEVTLAAQHHLRQRLAQIGRDPDSITFHLLGNSPAVMTGHNPRVQRRFRRVLLDRGVKLHTGQPVVRVLVDGVELADGTRVAVDLVLWTTSAGAHPWLAEAGLAVDDGGFVQVDDCLRSLSHPFVFAAGDVATMVRHPRPKAGVFAVRQGPVLADNLGRAARGLPLKAYRPQKHYLSLITTGDRYAVASRGPWSWAGGWLWRIKDHIDRKFMARYQDLPPMTAMAEPMRCGGCGAKVPALVLERVLARLSPLERPDVVLGRGDDAAVLRVPEGWLTVQSVDHFRSFIDDPHLLGRIAANHCLGDLQAMGAEPQSALAIATLPYGSELQMEDTLYQLLAGAVKTLDEAGAALVGGHSGEGQELSFGLAVTGLVRPGQLLTKAGLQAGQVLILTKPLGTGTLLAAAMQGRARSAWIEGALAAMQVSSGAAADCLRGFGATGCTDVTGFGLLGHLKEMVNASGVAAELDLAALPVLDGALETLARGIVSTLDPANRQAAREFFDPCPTDPRHSLLFDPQTAGGLLAGVAADQVGACVQELHRRGYQQARVVGRVVARPPDGRPLLVQ